MPLLSVLIPTYNRPKQLRQALESLKYLGRDIEVVIGNNGQHEPVIEVLRDIQPVSDVKVIQNKPGSTYPENLSALLGSACGEWLTILHDDDFFTCEAMEVPALLVASKNIDFIFSDHYIADALGAVSIDRSDGNSGHYDRIKLVSGPVANLQLLLANNSIAMDGFFVRTRLAQCCKIDISLKCFADLLLMAQIVLGAGNRSYYASKRLFAYRENEGLTTSGLLQDELLVVLQRIRILFTDPEASVALKDRINKQAWHSLKYSLKRLKVRSACAAVLALATGIKQ